MKAWIIGVLQSAFRFWAVGVIVVLIGYLVLFMFNAGGSLPLAIRAALCWPALLVH